MCFPTDNDTTPLQLRLVGGSDKQGDVEILYYGIWGYVCNIRSSFYINNANVACRQLGFPGASEIRSEYQDYTKTPLWLDSVQCFGNETGLEHCSHEGFGKSKYDCETFSYKLTVLCIGTYVIITYTCVYTCEYCNIMYIEKILVRYVVRS